MLALVMMKSSGLEADGDEVMRCFGVDEVLDTDYVWCRLCSEQQQGKLHQTPE
jgi:hypothetical protein